MQHIITTMKKIAFASITVFAALFLVLLSCKKKNDPSPSVNNIASCYITSYSENGIKQADFFYDSQNRLSKSNWYDTLGKTVTSFGVYTYNANSLLTNLSYYDTTNALTFYTVYTYNSDNTLATDTNYSIYNKVTSINQYDVYSYNPSKQIVQVNTYSGNPIQPFIGFILYSTTTYTYNAQGNVAEEKYYDTNGSLTEKTDYTYDNGNDFALYTNLQLGTPEFTNKNNVLTAIAVDSTGNIVPKDSYTSANTYNSNNYPTSIAAKFQNNTSQTLTFSYNCP